ncbi:MAG: hypothetical protein EBR30_00970 [Cytophagia bacterium]|nr:hypothetical protein [Cytophagia bacterium]NBW33606.1 hypothetical protein [Cytophagia bacterium]
MLTYETIKDALLTNPPGKVIITDGVTNIPIFGASTSEADPSITVAPYTGVQFKLTDTHELKIIN